MTFIGKRRQNWKAFVKNLSLLCLISLVLEILSLEFQQEPKLGGFVLLNLDLEQTTFIKYFIRNLVITNAKIKSGF